MIKLRKWSYISDEILTSRELLLILKAKFYKEETWPVFTSEVLEYVVELESYITKLESKAHADKFPEEAHAPRLSVPVDLITDEGVNQ